MKVGIIGCGRMGRERARCAAALGATIEAVFDPDAERGRWLHEQFGAAIADSAEACLSHPLDAVFVCVPPGYRGVVETACADRGIALFVEKPVGLSGSDAIELLQTIENNQIINGVGYMNRYRASVRTARSKVASCKVIGFSAYWVCKRYAVPWWGIEALSGGPHNEQATHMFDLSRYLFGEIDSVDCEAVGDSRVTTILRFHSGVLGTTLYSCEGSAKDIGLRIFTEEGMIALKGWEFRIAENTVDGVSSELPDEDIFLEETRTVLQAVRERKQNLILSSFRDAMKTQLAMDASRESTRTRTRVQVHALDHTTAHD